MGDLWSLEGRLHYVVYTRLDLSLVLAWQLQVSKGQQQLPPAGRKASLGHSVNLLAVERVPLVGSALLCHPSPLYTYRVSICPVASCVQSLQGSSLWLFEGSFGLRFPDLGGGIASLGSFNQLI